MIRTLSLALVLAGCDLVFPPGEFAPSVDAEVQPMNCPQTYSSIAGAPSVYRIETVKGLTWQDAEAACAADTLGQESHLVVFDDISELIALRTAMPGGGYMAAVGYARDPGDPVDRFTAITGESLSSVSNLWEPGEPNGGTEYIAYFTNIEELLDGPHTLAMPYVCECDGRPPTETFMFP